MAVSGREPLGPVNLVGLHEGAAGASVSFCQQGDATTPVATYPTGFALQFPSPSAVALRARAWVNELTADVVVTLFKNGLPALKSDGVTPVTLVIPAGSIGQVADAQDVVFYSPNDAFDVRLDSAGGGVGNVALIGVAIEALSDGRQYASLDVNLTGKIVSTGAMISRFCQQGDVTTPAQEYFDGFELQFPAARASYLKARCWKNELEANLLIRLKKNGETAVRSSFVIINATFATPIVITTFKPHGLVNEGFVYVLIDDVTGNLGANGEFGIVVTGPNSFQLFNLNGSPAVGTGLYTGGGTASPLVILNVPPGGAFGTSQVIDFKDSVPYSNDDVYDVELQTSDSIAGHEALVAVSMKAE